MNCFFLVWRLVTFPRVSCMADWIQSQYRRVDRRWYRFDSCLHNFSVPTPCPQQLEWTRLPMRTNSRHLDTRPSRCRLSTPRKFSRSLAHSCTRKKTCGGNKRCFPPREHCILQVATSCRRTWPTLLQRLRRGRFCFAALPVWFVLEFWNGIFHEFSDCRHHDHHWIRN